MYREFTLNSDEQVLVVSGPYLGISPKADLSMSPRNRTQKEGQYLIITPNPTPRARYWNFPQEQISVSYLHLDVP